MVVVARETEEADKIRESVAGEEAIAQTMADSANAIKEDCEKELAEAMPALKAAEKAVQNITKNDITTVKQYKNPPADVKYVLEAVCILMHQPPVRINDPATQKMVNDYWGPSLKLVSKIDFLDQILKYDKEGIDQKTIDKLKEYIENPKFDPKALESVSSIAANLCTWCHAIYKFYHINLVVVPKKESLAKA